MLSQENYDKAMEGMEACKKGFADLLKDVPQLALTSNNVFQRLGNSITQVARAAGLQIKVTNAAGERKEKSQLTHILGRPIESAQSGSIQQQVAPTEQERTDMQLYMDQADEELLNSDAKSLKEKYGELTLRGLAIRLGMNVTPTEPEKINAEVIKAMKEAKLNNIDRQSQKELAEATAKAPAPAQETLPPEQTTIAAK